MKLDEAIELIKERLEVKAGRLCVSATNSGINPKEDSDCHDCFLSLAHLEAVKDYIKSKKIE